MDNKVYVTADALGNVIGVSPNNPDYGWIRVETIVNEIKEGGWFKLVKRSALIKGLLEDLKQADYQEGDEISGKIIVKEQLVPFYDENPDKHLKIAGDTGVICSYQGSPIFRDSFFTNNPHAEDEFIQHDNQEEIRTAQSAMKALLQIGANAEAEL